MTGKGRKIKLAYGTGAMFCLAGFIAIVAGFHAAYGDTVATQVPRHTSMMSIGGLFMIVGALWISVATKWTKQAAE